MNLTPSVVAAPHREMLLGQPQKNAYDSPPWWYDVRGYLILNFSYRSTLGEQIRFFSANLKRRHLEVAIGTGTLFKMVLRRARRDACAPEEITGLDYSCEMLAGARVRFRKEAGIKLLQESVMSLPFPDNSFDSINIANALHCFSNVPGALAEIRRVLAPGGTLAVNALLYPRGFALSRKIANSINNWGIRKGILYSPFNESELLELVARSGLTLCNSRISGNCLFFVVQK
ncbi:MAG TPA: class I SAM-dependent methyltransferase [Planctomycetota bacterium]|nr:class I SAM-dependent methyltransferase [Planctomycetota bacterium]